MYTFRDVTWAIIGEGGGGCLFIYSCYARRISLDINSNSKEIRGAEHEYMNKHHPISVVVTSLYTFIYLLQFVLQ